MKRLLYLLVLVFSATFANAQVPADFQNASISKDAKKQAKDLSKSGWRAGDGLSSIERQVNTSMLMQVVMMEDEDGNPAPRYILATAEATSTNDSFAYKTARTICEGQVAQALQTKIEALVEREWQNRQLSATEAQTKEEFKSQLISRSKASLSRLTPIMYLSKDEGTKKKVQVTIAYDLMQLKNKN